MFLRTSEDRVTCAFVLQHSISVSGIGGMDHQELRRQNPGVRGRVCCLIRWRRGGSPREAPPLQAAASPSPAAPSSQAGPGPKPS